MVLDGELLSSTIAGERLTGHSMLNHRGAVAMFTDSTGFTWLNPLAESSAEDTLMLDLTTIYLMLVGLRRATMGGLRMAFLQRLEE